MDHLTTDKGGNDAGHAVRDRVLRLLGGCADMVCAVHARMPGKRGVEPGLAARRLVVEYVGDGADALRIHRLDQRRPVHNVRARRVDEDRARAHARQDVAIDEPRGLRTAGDVQGEEVAILGKLPE